MTGPACPFARPVYHPAGNHPRSKPGADVVALQRGLWRGGYLPGPASRFGEVYTVEAAEAVQAFQQAMHIRPTGNVGFATWEALRHAERKGHPGEPAFDQRACALAAQAAGELVETPKEKVQRVGADAANYWILHRDESDYAQVRPFPLVKPPEIPDRTDCLPPDAMIAMSDGSRRPIRDIRSGDSVLDRDGEPAVVKRVMSRSETMIYEIVVAGRRAPFRVTIDHPVWSVRGDRSDAELGNADFWKARHLKRGDWLAELSPQYRPQLSRIKVSDWLPSLPTLPYAEEEVVIHSGRGWRSIRRCPMCGETFTSRRSDQRRFCSQHCYHSGQAYLYHRPRVAMPDQIILDEDFGRWCGWYLAEGSVHYQAKSHRPAHIRFSLGPFEQDHIDEIIRLGRRIFGLSGSIEHRPTGITAIFYNSELAAFMTGLGSRSIYKQIPDSWMAAPISFLNGVAMAHLAGDGHVDKRRRAEHITSSPELAEQLYRIGRWTGRSDTSRRIIKPTEQNKMTVPQHRIAYTLERVRAKVRGVVEYGAWTFRRIDDIRLVPYVGDVYDLEVEQAHSFVADGFAVHNCSGYITTVYFAAGAPDPNGRGYDGLGYTGVEVGRGVQVPLAAIDLLDLVFYGRTLVPSPAFPVGSPTHVAVYIGGGFVASDGSQSGPQKRTVGYREIHSVRRYPLV